VGEERERIEQESGAARDTIREEDVAGQRPMEGDLEASDEEDVEGHVLRPDLRDRVTSD